MAWAPGARPSSAAYACGAGTRPSAVPNAAVVWRKRRRCITDALTIADHAGTLRNVKPLVLLIRDGWGVCDEDADAAARHGNAVRLARLPVLEQLLATYPHCLLQACGEAVGLPPGQMGNSEVGHQNLGAGRVTYQDLMRISLAIKDGSFFRTPVLLKVMGEVRRTGKRLHLMGLLSDGGVHSHIQHLFGLLEMAPQQHLAADHVIVHAILDGRDTPPRSGVGYLEQLEGELQRVGIGRIGTVSGRYYSMDRDNRAERTKRAYDAYVL